MSLKAGSTCIYHYTAWVSVQSITVGGIRTHCNIEYSVIRRSNDYYNMHGHFSREENLRGEQLVWEPTDAF